MDPIRGTEGSIKVGPTVSAVEFKWAGKWNVKIERSSQTIGPHIGDENEYEVATGKKGSFTVEATIPKGGDAGQDDLIDAFEAAEGKQIVFRAALGKVVTFPNPVFSELEIEQDAKGSHTLKASGKGAYTIAQDV